MERRQWYCYVAGVWPKRAAPACLVLPIGSLCVELAFLDVVGDAICDKVLDREPSLHCPPHRSAVQQPDRHVRCSCFKGPLACSNCARFKQREKALFDASLGSAKSPNALAERHRSVPLRPQRLRSAPEQRGIYSPEQVGIYSLPADVVFNPLADEEYFLSVLVEDIVVVDDLFGVGARPLDAHQPARQNR